MPNATSSNDKGFAAFELDLIEAVEQQLFPLLDALEGLPLTKRNLQGVPEKQGVYLLTYKGEVSYVGKTDAKAGLRKRLLRHAHKFEQRNNIQPDEVFFKAVQILVLTAMDVETRIISRYNPQWNGSGFGANDPGRQRETTAKSPCGFDAQFPINIDKPLQVLEPGKMSVHEALIELKTKLPYCLRFQVANGSGGQAFRHKPHPDLKDARIKVTKDSMSVREIMRMVVAALPSKWKATYFVSHIILYRDNPTYPNGEEI